MSKKSHSIFFTGGSGFIGRALLQSLGTLNYDKLFCLVRSSHKFSRLSEAHPYVSFLHGTLSQVETYASKLEECETVVHLAALTGKGTREEFFSSNVQDTATLIDQCKKAGVKNFLYVSTIATKFQDQSYYYYAQSKLQGEDAVKASGLLYTIMRPTLVVGKSNAACQALKQLVMPPFLFILGTGKILIQPIFVNDLVVGLLDIIQSDRFMNKTYEFGGPQPITIEDFLIRLYRETVRKDPRFIIRIPLGMIVPLLGNIEKLCSSLLPVTAGQFSTFRNEGTITENSLFQEHRSKMKAVGDMIKEIASEE